MKKAAFWGLFFILLIAAVFKMNGCAPQSAQDANKLIVWYWMTDRRAALDELARQYKEETGIEVEFKLFFPPDIYSQKVIAAARAENLPDIFGILGEKKTVASFIKAGHIVDITSFMKADDGAWQDRFYPRTLETVIFQDNNTYEVPAGIYGVPVDTTVMQFSYNKTLFKAAGLDPDTPPETFSEFIDFAKKVKKKTDAVGFICGWGEGWLLNALATEWAVNVMGMDAFQETIAGNIPYTDERWIQVFSLFRSLKEEEILAPTIATMTNKESEDAFARDKAAFSFNGSWAVNVYGQLNKDVSYSFFSLPRIMIQNPVRVWGGAGTVFRVSAYSRNKQAAIDFLRWITLPDQQRFLIRETNNLPAIKGCEEALPPLLKSLLATYEQLTHPDTWPLNEDSRVIEVMNRGLQQIVMGLKSPQEVAQEIQAKKEKISR